MSHTHSSVITGTGCYIPERRITNQSFLENEFFDAGGNAYDKTNEEIIAKFKQITGIEERRYVKDNLLTSDIAAFAAERALESAGVDKEKLDYILVAHNFGDVRADNRQTDLVPSLASRVKYKLEIKNSRTIPYDLPFGCPGWVEGMKQAHYYLQSGDARYVMVIGAETLSRIIDPHDRDSMIYADGAGATLLERRKTEEKTGILSHTTRNDTLNHAFLLRMEESFHPRNNGKQLYLKMNGRKLYEYALTNVPSVVKESLDQADLDIGEISKVLIHQANEKMDEAIVKRLFRLYGRREVPEGVIPMTISWLGNSSVATVPTLLDLLVKDQLEGHSPDDLRHLVFASVGAGMNINSMVYRMP